MAIAPNPTPESAVDPRTGLLLPMTDEVRKARSEALNQVLDELAEITDETDTDENWREVFRGIDEGRPHRPLFRRDVLTCANHRPGYRTSRTGQHEARQGRRRPLPCLDPGHGCERRRSLRRRSPIMRYAGSCSVWV